MWQARRTDDGFTVVAADDTPPKFAFLGVRACEIHAIAIQDKVFVQGPYADTDYQRRRQDNFIVAVNCGEAGGTCFCVSMNTGPKVEAGFDLALTELLDGERPSLSGRDRQRWAARDAVRPAARPASPEDDRRGGRGRGADRRFAWAARWTPTG